MNMMLKKRVFAVVMSAVMLVTGFSGVQAAQTAPGMEAEKRDTVVSPSGMARSTMVSISGMTSAEGIRICMVDTEDHSVWMREKRNDYTLLAGVPGNAGYADGALTQARFDSPWSVIAYKGGYLVSDMGNQVIRRIRDGQVTTFAGTAGKTGAVNGRGKRASFHRPTGMALGDDGTVYVADTGNHTIRAIDSKGTVTTFAGAPGKPGTKVGSCAASRFREPTGLFYYKGVLYVADSGNHRICSIANGKVKVVAGSASGKEGDASGKALQAALSNPQQIVMYKGVLYIADTGNGCIKRLKGGKLKTILKANSRREDRIPVQPRALMARNGYLYLGDVFTGDLYRIKL